MDSFSRDYHFSFHLPNLDFQQALQLVLGQRSGNQSLFHMQHCQLLTFSAMYLLALLFFFFSHSACLPVYISFHFNSPSSDSFSPSSHGCLSTHPAPLHYISVVLRKGLFRYWVRTWLCVGGAHSLLEVCSSLLAAKLLSGPDEQI